MSLVLVVGASIIPNYVQDDPLIAVLVLLVLQLDLILVLREKVLQLKQLRT